MQGKATIAGHPIHPMLVPFPIAFFAGAFVCDVIYVLRPLPFWPIMSVVLIGFGLIGALLAAAFGLIDYFTAPMSATARRTAMLHLVLGALTVVTYAVALALRYNDPTSVTGFAVTAVGVVVLGAAGALGGHLAYHHRIGVDEPPPPNAPRTPSPTP